MKITIETLRPFRACREGISDFAREFPDGLDTGGEWTAAHQIGALMTPMRKWLGWAWQVGMLPQWTLSGADLSGADLSGADRNTDDAMVGGWRVVGGRMAAA